MSYFYLNYPLLSFAIGIIIVYLNSQAILWLISKEAEALSMESSFIGLTLLSWGSNVGDTVNVASAAKINDAELLSTSLISAQIMNLQFSLAFPWLLVCLKEGIKNGNFSISFDKKLKVYLTTLPLLLVVFLFYISFAFNKFTLNKRIAFMFIFIYILYILLEFYINSLKH